MDPNTALENLRDAVKRINGTGSFDAVAEMIDSFEALDKWMSMGGFRPDAWRPRLTATLGKPRPAFTEDDGPKYGG